MNKRALIVAGLGITALAALTPAAVESASAAPAVPLGGHYQPIQGTPTGAPPHGDCGYPVNNAVLTLGPASQSAALGSEFHFSGTYGCNGHGLDRHAVYLQATYTTKHGLCNQTRGPQGAFSCHMEAVGSGSVFAFTQHAESQTVSATAH